MKTFGHALTDETGRYISVDDGFCDIVQADQAAILGRSTFDLTAPADRSRTAAKLKRLRDAGQPFTIRKRYIRGDGSLIWVRNQVSLFREGGSARIVVTVTTITPPVPGPGELLDAARFLFRSRRLRVQAFDSRLFIDPAWDVLIAVYVGEAEGRVLIVQSLCELAGIPLTAGIRWIRHLVHTGQLEIEGAAAAAIEQQPVRLSTEAHTRFERFLTDLIGWRERDPTGGHDRTAVA